MSGGEASRLVWYFDFIVAAADALISAQMRRIAALPVGAARKS